MPLVDVVLATRHRPFTLPYAIQSVLRQTEPSLRLHVVSHGSNPANEAVVRSLDDGRVRYLEASASDSLGRIINGTVRSGGASFIAYMTDDDLWFPDHIEGALATLETGGTEIVAFRPAAVRYPDHVDPYIFAFDWSWAGWQRWARHRFIGMECYMHRRALLERIGYRDEARLRFGDNDFYNRARRAARRDPYIDFITLLRFYARDWDNRYASLDAPPQRIFAELIQDRAWRERLRVEARRHGRRARVRMCQAREFTTLGLRSGVPFLRRLARSWHASRATRGTARARR
jgi:glycosyltransferase involved in cell wall biosynthesis